MHTSSSKFRNFPVEFLKYFLIFGISIISAEELTLPPIEIPHQNIQNFFDFKADGGMSVEMILNNKAKINGKWYQKGDRLSKYQIYEVKNNHIVLKDSAGIVIMPISKKTDFLKLHSDKSKQPKISLSKKSNKGK